MLKLNNTTKSNPHTINRIKQEIDYFIACPGTESDKATSIEQHSKCMMNIVMSSQEFSATRPLSLYMSKMM